MALVSWVKLGLLAVVVSVSACSSSEDEDAAVTPAVACQQSCVASMGAQCSAEVGQSASACESDCMAAFTVFAACEAQFIDMLQCDALKASSGWECDADGASNPRASVCVAEQAAAESCTSS